MYVTQNCEFDWDPPTRGRILGSFLYGYILTSMAGGFMAKSYGVKTPFVCAGIGNAVCNLLCPTAVLVHTELLFACRLLQGMFAVNARTHTYTYIGRRTRRAVGISVSVTAFFLLQGLTVGPVFQLLSAWTSDEEVSTLLSLGLSGFSFGSIVAYPLSGYLCTANYNGFGGWPLIYYVPGKNDAADRRTHDDRFLFFFFMRSAVIDFSDRVRFVRRVLVSIPVQRTRRSSEYIARGIHLLVGKR